MRVQIDLIKINNNTLSLIWNLIKGIKIIRYESSVYYANSENFVYKIIKLSQVDPYDLIAKINKKKAEHAKMLRKLKSDQVIWNKIFNWNLKHLIAFLSKEKTG